MTNFSLKLLILFSALPLRESFSFLSGAPLLVLLLLMPKSDEN